MINVKFNKEEQYKDSIGIYKIINTNNNKVYIGQTKQNFQKRYWHHQWKLRHHIHDNKHLQQSWDKYGEYAFEYVVVEKLDIDDDIDEREKYWINYYKTQGICYNIQDGGQPVSLNRYISPEMRKHVGEINKQKMLGKKLSEETRMKISKSHKGKHYKRKTDVLAIDQAKRIKEMLVAGHPTYEISDTLQIPYKFINNILSSNAWAHVHVDGWEEFQENRQRCKGKPVHNIGRYPRCKTPEEISNIIKTYNKTGSYSETSKVLNISRETVVKYVKLDKQTS